MSDIARRRNMAERLSLIVTLPSTKKAKTILTRDILESLNSDYLTNQLTNGWATSKLVLDLSELFVDDEIALRSVKRFAKIMIVYSRLRIAGFKTIDEYNSKLELCNEMKRQLEKIEQEEIHWFISDESDGVFRASQAKLNLLREQQIVVPEIDLDIGFELDPYTVLLLDYLGEHIIVRDQFENSAIDYTAFSEKASVFMPKYSSVVIEIIYTNYIEKCRSYDSRIESHYQNLQLCVGLTKRIYESGEISREDLITALDIPTKTRAKFKKAPTWEDYEKYIFSIIDKESLNVKPSESPEFLEVKGRINRIIAELNRRSNHRYRGGCHMYRFIPTDELQKLLNDQYVLYDKLYYS